MPDNDVVVEEPAHPDETALRRRRRYTASVFLPLFLLALLLIIRYTSFIFLPLRYTIGYAFKEQAIDTFIFITVLLLLLTTISAAVVAYLQIGINPLSQIPRYFSRSFEAALRSLITESFSSSVAGLAEQIQSAPVPKSQERAEDERFRYITTHAEELVGRLSTAIEQQRSRNNINVGFGFFITLVGISVLIYFVQDSRAVIDPEHPSSVLTFLPRLSLVILIELFAYFFLNLYRDGLAEMKYLQNELTTIRMRTLGLRAAIYEGHQTSAAEIMQSFAATDRNLTGGKPKASAETATELLKTAQEAIKVAAKLTGSKMGKGD